MTGVVFLANLLGKWAPNKFPAASRARKYLKRVAVGATGLLDNEPEAQFRVFDIFLKNTNSQKRISIIKIMKTLGEFVPMPVIRPFNQNPGSEKRDVQ